ncbi:hypothetical protein GW933_02905 [Candidatus Falkowbacteria bacterium]|uniref:Uncharacterized protein n=1 Tax=Candidatus Buchananbacteria bacterium CG10_big_fil_rev_8_21_14_0_10_33_19 TaxID=1974525 RepID=A0A2H0W4I4_9BACT|nr:hypothetical protein [Candidatus Falkowbacteria bacterium]PIS06259.1 MAG: hypothetical protein COT80_01660 [Candidatus Buchananbacteria bacterium CG10_big_fil_rev_8_21_14_0_10_33_19]
MSDNLAHKLNSYNFNNQSSVTNVKDNSFNSNSPQLTIDRLKHQSKNTDKTANNNQPNNSPASQLNQAKNIASKALSGNLTGSATDSVEMGTQVGSQWLLTTLWGSVWVDWTLLSLLGLNVFLAFSLLLPNYVCQFGDDYLIGKWLPSKDLAKWTEIILLMIINAFILTIILMLTYLVYKFATCGTWDLFNSWLSGALPGGDTALSAVQKRCFQ